jgi:hypothetical protein
VDRKEILHRGGAAYPARSGALSPRISRTRRRARCAAFRGPRTLP